MRVLLSSANFLPHVGGIERFVDTLARGLAARGHETAVLCCRSAGAPLREESHGYTTVRVPATETLERRAGVPYPLPDPLALRRALATELPAADVVHVQDAIYATSIAALRAARRAGVPSVLTQHVAFVPQRSGALDAVQRVALATLGRSARLASAVATLNPAVADFVRAQWGIDGVRVLPVGVGAPAAVDPRAVRASLGLPAGRPLFLFVGRDVPKKGLDVLLAAAGKGYEIVAVTDRPPGSERPGTRVLPFMEHEQLLRLLGAVDGFVLPSEGEGFPIALQEALAAGVPVVTTRGEGYGHYLGEEDVLWVARDPSAVRAALERLAGDPALRVRLGERARTVAARHFSSDRFVAAYEALYAELTGR